MDYLLLAILAFANMMWLGLFHGNLISKQWVDSQYTSMEKMQQRMNSQGFSMGNAMLIQFLTVLLKNQGVLFFCDTLNLTYFNDLLVIHFLLLLGIVVPVRWSVWVWERKKFSYVLIAFLENIVPCFILSVIQWLYRNSIVSGTYEQYSSIIISYFQ